MKPKAKRRHDPILRLEHQQGPADCAIACLASLTGRPYRDCLIYSAAESGPFPHERGLFMKEIMRIAGYLGYPMRLKRRCNLWKDKGILDIAYTRNDDRHVVVLMAGLIFDMNDLTVWLPAEYRAAKRATFHSILVPK